MQNVEPLKTDSISVSNAFSKQAINYDVEDEQNQILQDMRKQVYKHISAYIKNGSSILEINAGTGIDAVHFVQLGHTVHATDLSKGMIAQIEKKIINNSYQNRFTCQQLSYDQLHLLNGRKFDYVFSNFGGLNCTDDLSKIASQLPSLVNRGGYITWVIMPPVCLWELLWIFKGRFKEAFRRFKSDGVLAHLEDEYFKTYYHSLTKIKKAFGKEFKFIKSEGLCALSPPPSKGEFPKKHPILYPSLMKLDFIVRSGFPFNRWADHIIVTFQLVDKC